jgi:hypothetical protein
MSGNNKRNRGSNRGSRGSNRGRGGSLPDSPVTSGNENNEGNQEKTSLPNSPLNLGNTQPETQSSEDMKEKKKSLTGLEESMESLKEKVGETDASISNLTAEKKEEKTKEKPNVVLVPEKEKAPTLDKVSEDVSNEEEVTVEKDKKNSEEEKNFEKAMLLAEKSDSKQPVSALDTINTDEKIATSEKVENPDLNISKPQEQENIPVLKATVRDSDDIENEEEVVEHLGTDGKPVNTPTVPINSVIDDGEANTKPAASADPKNNVVKNDEKDNVENEKATKNQSLALSQKQQEQDKEKKERQTSLIVGASVGLLAVGYAAALKFLSNRIKNIWFDRAMIAGTVITSVVSAVFLTKALIETKNISKRGNELNIDKVENNKKEVLEK